MYLNEALKKLINRNNLKAYITQTNCCINCLV